MKHLGIAWPRLLVESVAIVASILLAFAIDAWYQSSRDQKIALQSEQNLDTERQQIEQRLKTELQKVSTDVETMLAMVAEARQSAIGLGDFFYGVSEAEDFPGMIVHFYMLGQDYGIPLDTVTYQDLVSTGRIGFLSDAIQRQSIQSAYQQMQFVDRLQPYRTEYLLAVRGWIPTRVTIDIRQACGLSPETTAGSSSVLDCTSFQIDPDEAQTIINNISTNQALLAYQLRTQSLGAAYETLFYIKIEVENALASFD